MSESGSAPQHVSVLPVEVLHYLAPQPGEILVDATVGAGGHARLLAARVAPTGRLIGLDQDRAMLDLARPRFTPDLPVTLVQANFAELPRVLREMEISGVDGVLADLGFCSDQLDDVTRGLSFSREGPLDMRLNPDEGEPACDLLHRLPERELADVIYRYGEERFREVLRRARQMRNFDRAFQRTYDITVTNQDKKTVALLRGRSFTQKGKAVVAL